MIFVLLGFTPRILEHEQAKMREISDKHFPDNFVVQIYQGHLVDITQYWDPFPAARKAVENNIYFANIKTIAEKNAFMVKNCFDRLKSYVVDGQLLEDYVLDNVKALLECLRDSNVTVRWLMLHNNCRNSQFRECIQKAYDKTVLVDFLLALAKFESQFEAMIRKLVQSKAQVWDADRTACHDYIYEVSEYFAGNRQWSGKQEEQVDESYATWFAQVAEQIEGLDYKKSNKTGVKIQNLV
jgi:WASH complex subunit strumpellin